MNATSSHIAPDIFRQRLLIEGYYGRQVGKETIKEYFTTICRELDLRMYGEPIIFTPGSLGKEENQGYDAFVPLIDSGISLYVWSTKKFASIVIYTCKGFSSEVAIEQTKSFFQMAEVVTQEF